MSCICTGSLESENVALKEKLAAIAAAWKKLAPQLWVEEPDVAFTQALEAMHDAVRGEGEPQQSENEKLRAALGEAVKALEAASWDERMQWSGQEDYNLCLVRSALARLRPLLEPNSAEAKTK